MGERDTGPNREARFEALYKANYLAVSSYVRRRVPEGDAADVIARIFTVAWRRFEQMPPPPEDRLWLFGVARHCVSEHSRSARRRLRLHARIAEQPRLRPSAPGDLDPLSERVCDAFAALRQKDKEVLQLLLWDELSLGEAAQVLGCSVNAVEIRFRRALARIRESLVVTQPMIDSARPLYRAGSQWRI